jgi:hypothetical protein
MEGAAAVWDEQQQPELFETSAGFVFSSSVIAFSTACLATHTR